MMHLIDAKVSGHDQALPQRHDLFAAAGCEPQGAALPVPLAL